MLVQELSQLPKSAKEARKLNCKHYFTGNLCKYGHVDKRQTLDNSCCECNRIKSQKYKKNNLDKISKYNIFYYEINKEKEKRRNKNYFNKNKYKIYSKRKIRKNYDIQYKLKENLRTRLWYALKNNSKIGSAVEDLGCSIEDLKKRLEMLFLPDMNWGNYGKWHIDHIIPLSHFDLTDRKQFLQACSFINLQPMWAEDNLKKGDKITSAQILNL